MRLFVHNAHGDKQQPGNRAVRKELHRRPDQAGVVEQPAGYRYAAQPNQHQPHMADAGIGDEAFQVGLAQGYDGAVQHADDAQDDHRQGVGLQLFGEHSGVDAQQAVAAHFQHHAGQHHAAGGGRVGVGIGQPGMDGPSGQFDGKGGKEQPEQHAHGQGGAAGVQHRPRLQQGGHIKAAHAGADEHGDDGHQHKGGAQDGENQEFHRRVFPPAAAPSGNQQVHRHQFQFPEQEKQQEIQRGEYAHHGGLQHQQPDEVLFDAAADVE